MVQIVMTEGGGEFFLRHAVSGSFPRKSAVHPATSHTNMHIAGVSPSRTRFGTVMGRCVWIFDMLSLELLYIIDAKGSGLMKCLLVEDQLVYCPTDRGTVDVWDKDKMVRQIPLGRSGSLFYLG